MGWFGNVFSGVCSFVSNACSAIGSAVKSFVSTAGPMLATLGTKLNTALGFISMVVRAIGIVANLLKPEEKIEDLGEKALQAEDKGITLDSCDGDFEAYSKEIRAFKIDEDKKHSEIDRLAAGILFVQNGLDIKYPNMNLSSMYPFMVMNSQHFSPERMQAYFKAANELGYNFEKLANYFSGTGSAEDAKKADAFIVKAEQAMNPHLSAPEIQKQSEAIKKEVYEKL